MQAKSVIFALLLWALGVACANAADQSLTITLEAPKSPPTKVLKADDVPKKATTGETLAVDSSIKNAVFPELFKANLLSSDNGQCMVTCPHESGMISCPVGQTAACGCPGGYLSCGCR
jgi:hypothetical protein